MGERTNDRRALGLAVAVVGFAVLGVLLVRVGAEHDEQSRAFTAAPRATVWAALIAAHVATWPVVWRVGRDRLRELETYGVRPDRQAEIVRVVALAALLLVVWLPPQLGEQARYPTLWGHGARVGIAILGGYVAAVPCLLAVWRTHRALSRAVTDRVSALATFELLNPLRAVFTSALTAVGVLVTEATLATGALRGTLIQVDEGVAARFPPEFVVLYGGFFTLLLAAAAAPTYGRLRRRSADVVDTLLPVLPPTADGWRDRLAERRDLATFLHADTSATQAFQAAVLVAGPLLSGLVSLLVPAKG